MDIHAYEINSQSAASGTWSLNTPDFASGILRQVLLFATDSNVTFDFKLIDEKSNVVYDTQTREITPTFRLEDEVCVPLKGIYTARLYGASSDDTFSGRLMVED